MEDDRERPGFDASLSEPREAEGRCNVAEGRKEDCGGLNEGNGL